MAGLRLVQVAVWPATGLILHLDRRMGNLIVMLQKMLDTFEQRVVIVGWDHLNVQRHDRLFSDQPHVNVVDVSHLRNRAAQISSQLTNVN